MANCVSLTFAGISGNSFYFDASEHDEIDCDSFEYSKTFQNLVRCPDSRFLFLNEFKQFDMKNLNSQQLSSSDYKLFIDIYRDLSPQPSTGRAVMLYALKENKKYAAVCKNDKEISAEEIKEQRCIDDTKHRALFYMILDHQPNKYKLRSSLYPDKALGFDELDSNKLVLCPYDPDSELETIEIMK